MSKVFLKALKSLTAGFRDTNSLDPVFYYKHYPDLQDFKTEKSLRAHYRKHGKRENRFPNEAVYLTVFKQQILASSDEFNLSAYKYYNPDLLEHFVTDEEFVEHYVRHGRHEGRICLFPDKAGAGTDGSGDEVELWEKVFSPAEVIAWCGDQLERLPASRAELIEIFREKGVSELWPISFVNRFDPDFYRNVLGLGESEPREADDLYREWLTVGLPSGIAPNEECHLASMLGGASYPVTFDWRGYAELAKLGKDTDRQRALRHLFDKGSSNLPKYLSVLGDDGDGLLGHIGRYLLVRSRFREAVTAFELALDSKASPELSCLLGDAYLALGEKQDALDAYMKAISEHSSQIWPYLHVLDIYCSEKAFDAAFSLLRSICERLQPRVEYGRALRKCVDLYFQHQSACAHALLRQSAYNTGKSSARDMAHKLLRDTLDEIRRLYLDVDLLPAPIGGMADGHVSMLANDDLRQCTHYRVEQKAHQFEAAGIPLKIFSHHDIPAFVNSLVGAKCAIFYRVAATPDILRAILQATQMGLPTYYEIDDLIFDPTCYPDSFESFEGQISAIEYAGLDFGVPLFRYAMSMCDNSIASTTALAHKMQAITRSDHCLVVRNGLDERNNIAVQIGAMPRPMPDGKIRLFYGSGTKAHNADFNELIGPALLEIMQANAHVELVIVGHLRLRKEFDVFADRITSFSFTSDVNAYWSILASCHVNLAVLHPGPVADCKSEIKWLEAAVLQIPSVVSDTATYREVIEDGVDAFVASTTDEWRTKLNILIENPDLRSRIGALARAKALKKYDISVGAEIWRDEFGAKRAAMTVGAPRKLRILICNVFFYPQSIGGATRVVEDNVRNFLEKYEDLEIAVFCSDEGRGEPGQLHITSFNGSVVYRVTTPIEENMDWRAFRPENAKVFDRVLEDFRPDLIHFHCIQRLSASIVEVALSRDIPYIVTLHDGWWISDNQFLVDDDGFLRIPTADILADSSHSKAPIPSIERRQRLNTLLSAAAARLTVSAPFAQIHKDVGIEDVQVLENGVSPLQPMAKVSRADGRVALGHIGGRASHKGAFLVEAALRQEEFRNLHLTMIDGRLSPGHTVETIWGTTPVTLTGHIPQSKVNELYARIDILLAPSTWPESFGLVTREALALGCWVVASSLGAIGQGVADGKNGFVIDTATTRDLKRVLYEIDADAERFRRSPDFHHAPLRPTSEQAAELRQLYLTLANKRGKSAVRPAVGPQTNKTQREQIRLD